MLKPNACFANSIPARLVNGKPRHHYTCILQLDNCVAITEAHSAVMNMRNMNTSIPTTGAPPPHLPSSHASQISNLSNLKYSILFLTPGFSLDFGTKRDKNTPPKKWTIVAQLLTSIILGLSRFVCQSPKTNPRFSIPAPRSNRPKISSKKSGRRVSYTQKRRENMNKLTEKDGVWPV